MPPPPPPPPPPCPPPPGSDLFRGIKGGGLLRERHLTNSVQSTASRPTSLRSKMLRLLAVAAVVAVASTEAQFFGRRPSFRPQQTFFRRPPQTFFQQPTFSRPPPPPRPQPQPPQPQRPSVGGTDPSTFGYLAH